MNKIKSIILDQTNWLEVTLVKVETITLPQEVVEGVADTVLRTQEVETTIHCESFGDSDEYQELLSQRLVELDVEITQELKDKLLEQKEKRYIPTQAEVDEANRQKLIDDLTQQIEIAKKELASLDWINSKYIREVQVLHTMTSEDYHLKYQVEYTRMVELVTLINTLEVQLGGL